jgi:hypothetical protein
MEITNALPRMLDTLYCATNGSELNVTTALKNTVGLLRMRENSVDTPPEYPEEDEMKKNRLWFLNRRNVIH